MTGEQLWYVGLDLSLTSTGMAWYCLAEDPPDVKTRVLKTKAKGAERLAWLSGQIMRGTADIEDAGGRIAMVGVEGYAFAANATRAHSIGELGGAVKRDLYVRGYHVVTVPPTSLKMWVADHGRADKDQMAEATQTHTGLLFDTDDEVDAFGLAAMAQMAYGSWETPFGGMTSRRQQALDGCTVERGKGYSE